MRIYLFPSLCFLREIHYLLRWISLVFLDSFPQQPTLLSVAPDFPFFLNFIAPWTLFQSFQKALQFFSWNFWFTPKLYCFCHQSSCLGKLYQLRALFLSVLSLWQTHSSNLKAFYQLDLTLSPSCNCFRVALFTLWTFDFLSLVFHYTIREVALL